MCPIISLYKNPFLVSFIRKRICQGISIKDLMINILKLEFDQNAMGKVSSTLLQKKRYYFYRGVPFNLRYCFNNHKIEFSPKTKPQMKLERLEGASYYSWKHIEIVPLWQ